MTPMTDTQRRQHDALHLAHRWFAFFEAPDLEARDRALPQHLGIFAPEVRLSGHQGHHVFAEDLASLTDWFATVPEERSSHHILHATFAPAPVGQSRLNMLVSYQAERGEGVQGAIMRYETRLSHGAEGARFLALDKTPILPDTRPTFDASRGANRVLALAHATLAGLPGGNATLREALGPQPGALQVRADVPEGSPRYSAVLMAGDPGRALGRCLLLDLEDAADAPLPRPRGLEWLERRGALV